MRPITVAVMTLAVLSTAGCFGSQAFVKPQGDGVYRLTVYEGMGGDAYKRWDEKAAEVCKGRFTNTERQYHNNPSGNSYLNGLIKCQ